MTNKSIDSQRLAVALRKKFGTPRALLRALGLDETLLTSSPGLRLALDARGNRLPLARDQQMPNGSAPTENAAQQLRLAIEEVLRDCEGGAGAGDVKRIIALLEKHAPLGAGDQEAEPETEELRRRERMPPALDVEAFSKVLRDKGIDEAVIEEALDMLPKSAIETGLPGGKFAEKRAAGMDARLDERFGLGRILVGDSGLTDRGRGIDRRPVPSTARLERINHKFGTDRIGVHGAAGGSTW